MTAAKAKDKAASTRKRQHILLVYLSDEEEAALEGIAGRSGMKKSAAVRVLLMSMKDATLKTETTCKVEGK